MMRTTFGLGARRWPCAGSAHRTRAIDRLLVALGMTKGLRMTGRLRVRHCRRPRAPVATIADVLVVAIAATYWRWTGLLSPGVTRLAATMRAPRESPARAATPCSRWRRRPVLATAGGLRCAFPPPIA